MLTSSSEVGRLPGCGDKIALLYADFEETGQLRELQEADSNGMIPVIKTFYNIWGVSAHTAKEFYEKGWRDLDDVIDQGWTSLTRSQQIGVKYYDEFLEKISRTEIDSIANTVLEHASKIRDGFQLTVVGGYRRGKTMSGDVDLMLSHVDEEATRNLIAKLVASLEHAKYISMFPRICSRTRRSVLTRLTSTYAHSQRGEFQAGPTANQYESSRSNSGCRLRHLG